SGRNPADKRETSVRRCLVRPPPIMLRPRAIQEGLRRGRQGSPTPSSTLAAIALSRVVEVAGSSPVLPIAAESHESLLRGAWVRKPSGRPQEASSDDPFGFPP